MIRVGYLIEKIVHAIVKPKYLVSKHGVAFRVDTYNNTIKRIYPDVPQDLKGTWNLNNSTILEYVKYSKEQFYSKQSAIDYSKKFYKENGDKI